MAIFLFFFAGNLIFAGGEPEPMRRVSLQERHIEQEKVANRLLQLGFDLGHQGYDGFSENEEFYNVVERIKYFLGYPEGNQGINSQLRDFILDNANTSILENIRTILPYNTHMFEKSMDLFRRTSEIGDYGGEAFVYYSRDNTPKIMEYYHGNEYTSQRLTCYFLNVNNYFVKYEYVTPNPSDRVEKMYYFSNNTLYEVTNGTRVPSNERHNIVETVNEIISRFRSAYR